jgi:hypothetical protein
MICQRVPAGANASRELTSRSAAGTRAARRTRLFRRLVGMSQSDYWCKFQRPAGVIAAGLRPAPQPSIN